MITSRNLVLMTSIIVISILILAVTSTSLYALVDLGPLVIVDPERSDGLDSSSDGENIGVAYLKDSTVFLGILESGPNGRAQELQNHQTQRIIENVGVAPSIHIAGGKIFVVAKDQFTQCSSIDIRNRCDHQQDFANPPTCEDASTSDVTASHDGDHVYIAWEDGHGNICFKARHGGEFSESVILESNGYVSSTPIVGTSSDGKSVHVIWQSRGTNKEIYYSRIVCDLSTPGEETCNAKKPINLSKTGGVSEDHELAVEGSNVIVTWLDHNTGNGDPYVRVSKNNGGTFGPTRNLDPALSSSGPPDPAAINHKVVVCWDDKTDIFCRQSTNNGDSFADKINVSKTNNNQFLKGESRDAQVDFTPEQNGEIYVAWTDILALEVTGINIPIGTRIVLASESDDGINYSAPVNLSDAPNNPDPTKNILSERMHLDVEDDVATWDPLSRRG